jgi:hypothetical protein
MYLSFNICTSSQQHSRYFDTAFETSIVERSPSRLKITQTISIRETSPYLSLEYLHQLRAKISRLQHDHSKKHLGVVKHLTGNKLGTVTTEEKYTISDVNLCPATQQQFHDVHMSSLASNVEGSMVRLRMMTYDVLSRSGETHIILSFNIYTVFQQTSDSLHVTL